MTETAGHTVFREQLDRFVRAVALTLDIHATGATLAERACLSRFHFQRAFQRALGETPGAFRRRILLERAAFQLNTLSEEITEIGLSAGYESLEGFSRAFRRAFGVSPSHYRRIAPHSCRLPSRNGIHYDPNIRAPRLALKGDPVMDLIDRLIQHDAWL